MVTTLPLLKQASTLLHIPDDKLIHRFTIKNKGKTRDVNDPVPELKVMLKEWNVHITAYYEQQLREHAVSHIAHAYLPNKSIQTNAQAHLFSPVAQFDFQGFYDSCKFDYFAHALRVLDPSINEQNEHIIKRLLIDNRTDGVTQGLPVSGALAGLALIPFWVELEKRLPDTMRFTQYSDDLTISFTGKEPPEFTIPILTQKIYEALHHTGLDFKLKSEKTRIQRNQYRKVTGIRINHHNQTTPARNDYRFLRHALYILSKSDDLERELATWGFDSKESFIGKVSYMRSIDTTGKINRLIMKHRDTCQKHGLFATWIASAYKQSAFA